MVVTGDITQVDLPRDQQSGLIVVGDILDGVEGIEFVRFGGEDVVRHKLVQRIVDAYDEHAERAGARAAARATQRAPPCLRSRSSGSARRSARGEIERARARSRWRRRGVEDGHVAVEFVDAERDRASSTREHRGKDGPTDVLSFPVDEAGAGRPARASSATS